MTSAPAGPAEQPAAHLEERGSGRPVLLLHGWGASSALMAPVAALLDPIRYRLIAPDLPGFGRTPAPPVPWSMADYAAWTATLLDRLGLGRVDVVGHSFGGRVILKLAAEQPERFARIVLTGSAGIRPRRGAGYHLRVRTHKLLRPLTRLPGGLGAAARRRAEERGSRDYRAAAGVMRGTFVRVVNEDLRACLPRLVAPVLLVWGDRDAEVPIADGRLMEASIGDAALVVFEGGSHFAYLEQAQRFATIVDAFLSAPVHP